jgi:hypothetical protein
VSERRPGDTYAAFLEAEQKAEIERKSSLEQRGLSVITTSGAIAALLFALPAAFGTSTRDERATRAWFFILLVTAAVLLAMASMVGLVVAAPHGYRFVTGSELDRIVDEDLWLEPDDEAVWRIAQTRRDIVKRAQEMNVRKGWILRGALLLQVLGVASLLAATVALMT